MSLAYVFPGQGSQYVGMGKSFFTGELEEWFDDMTTRSEHNLKQIIFEGPADKLEDTRITQPAVYLVNQTILKYLRKKSGLQPDYFAGHSLGEYNALVASARADFSELFSVVETRGKAMGKAADKVNGGMAAILRIDQQKIEEICQNVTNDDAVEGSVQAALLNSPDQIVISGAQPALDAAIEEARDSGALKAVELDVSGPWHSQYMKPAIDPLNDALSSISWSDGSPIVTNVEGTFLENSPEKGLIDQLTEPVQWIRTINTLVDEGVETFVEVGPGDALTGMIERIIGDKKEDITVRTTDTLENTRSTIEAIS